MTKRLRPDVITLDVVMPVMDGIEMVRGLKAAGTTSGMSDRMYDFAGLNAVLGTDGILARAKQYDAKDAT